jgi:hypothetical protein
MHAGGGSCDGDPEEVGESPEVRHGELAMEEPGDVLEEPRCRCSKDDVIDVQQEIGHLGALTENEEGHIRLRGDEAESVGVVSEPLVPCARGLLEAVE